MILNIQLDSASPVSFLKQNVSHELKLRDPYVKIYPLDQATKEIYCGFTDNAINITGKVILPFFSSGWSHRECHFFLTKGHEKNILGNDNLPKVGIEVFQKHFPLYTNKNTCKSINLILSIDKKNKLDMISKTFKQLFLRIGKIKNQTKITHFHEPLKTNSTKRQTRSITLTGLSKNRIKQTQIRWAY